MESRDKGEEKEEGQKEEEMKKVGEKGTKRERDWEKGPIN